MTSVVLASVAALACFIVGGLLLMGTGDVMCETDSAADGGPKTRGTSRAFVGTGTIAVYVCHQSFLDNQLYYCERLEFVGTYHHGCIHCPATQSDDYYDRYYTCDKVPNAAEEFYYDEDPKMTRCRLNEDNKPDCTKREHPIGNAGINISMNAMDDGNKKSCNQNLWGGLTLLGGCAWIFVATVIFSFLRCHFDDYDDDDNDCEEEESKRKAQHDSSRQQRHQQRHHSLFEKRKLPRGNSDPNQAMRTNPSGRSMNRTNTNRERRHEAGYSRNSHHQVIKDQHRNIQQKRRSRKTYDDDDVENDPGEGRRRMSRGAVGGKNSFSRISQVGDANNSPNTTASTESSKESIQDLRESSSPHNKQEQHKKKSQRKKRNDGTAAENDHDETERSSSSQSSKMTSIGENPEQRAKKQTTKKRSGKKKNKTNKPSSPRSDELV